MSEVNKYGVPYHSYNITLINGTEINIDVGYEEDWGNIQQCTPDDCPQWENAVGYGNDLDGHTEIIKVIDNETDIEIDPWKWANECVWKYVDNYSS